MNATDQKNRLPELKPCPFCGDAARLFLNERNSFFSIFCPDRSCSVFSHTCEFASIQEAVAAWNTRRDQPAQHADAEGEFCTTCLARLEVGSLFCSRCRTTQFFQLLAPLAESGEEIPLPAPGMP